MAKYNKKEFLLPNSERSMATYHAKVQDDDTMKLTIHDCRGSIQLWNDLKDKEQVEEALEKLTALKKGIEELMFFVKKNYTEQKPTRSYADKVIEEGHL
jgi:hypothetical protein